MADNSNQKTYLRGEPVAFLCVKLKRGEVYLLPYSSLISAHFAPETGGDKHDLLDLTFASHDVTVTGFKLDEIASELQNMTCHCIWETNSANAAFTDKAAIVEITVVDKVVKKKA
jgi:hypothetical protein